MNIRNTKTGIETKIVISAASVFSIGILSGCEYCEPLLFAVIATVALKGLYYISRTFYEAMQIKPCYK